MKKKNRIILYASLGIIVLGIALYFIYTSFVMQSTTCSTTLQCNDNNECTTDICLNNVCSNIPITNCATNCNDNNICTTDILMPYGCAHVTISSCCTSSSQCDDNNMCTKDTCSNNVCSHSSINTACNDNNVCTTDICQNNACSNIPNNNCCTTSSQCNDNDACTTDTCSNNVCKHIALSCNDNNECTTDLCSNNACHNVPITGCGTNCNDNNECTTDILGPYGCAHVTIEGCGPCTSNEVCADNNECTTDTCVSGKCEHNGIPNCAISFQCSDATSKKICENTEGCSWSYNGFLHLGYNGVCSGTIKNPCTSDNQCLSMGEQQVCQNGFCIPASHACAFYQDYKDARCGFNPLCWLGITKPKIPAQCKTAWWVYISGFVIFILLIVIIKNLIKYRK
jgi:hypothetical protein